MNKPIEISTAAGHRFHTTGGPKQYLFQVQDGVSVCEALQSAADLINMAKSPVFEAGMETPLQGNPAWLVHLALEAAEAAIYSVLHGLDNAGALHHKKQE